MGLAGVRAGGIIAHAIGSSIDGVLFNPSDTIDIAYTINVTPSEELSVFNTSYFQEVSKVMLGRVYYGGEYVADNSRYVVPNQARLQTESPLEELGYSTLIDVKPIIPKGTGAFIGTSEGDLKWEPTAAGSYTPYSVRFQSSYHNRPDMTIATTVLEERLGTAYYAGTDIETRFSIELIS